MKTKYLIIFILVLIIVYVFQTLPKVGIISMMKYPHQITTWLKYHLSLGIDKIYLFMDDPKDENIQIIHDYVNTNNLNNKITVTVIDDVWKKENNYQDDPEKDAPLNWNVRQDMSVNHALRIGKEDNVDILIHIDSDELLYMEKNNDIRSVFKKYAKNNTFKFDNVEIAPDREDYKNCFTEAKYFRKNGDGFIAYGNGKSAGRVGKVRSHGPHYMLELDGKDTTKWLTKDELIVLHYVSCNLEELTKKYKLYSNFKNNNWEWATFHLSARDQLKSCEEKKTCEENAKILFNKRMKNEKDDIYQVDINKIIEEN